MLYGNVGMRTTSWLCLTLWIAWIQQLFAWEQQSRRAFGSALLIASSTSCAVQPSVAASASSDSIFQLGGPTSKYQPIVVGDWEPSNRMLFTKLAQERILADELSPLGASPFSDNELYFPDFLFGEWSITATLRRKIYPYGYSFVPFASLIEGSPLNRLEQVGDSCNFAARFFSTLPNSLTNQVTVNFGMGVPKSKIIQDRAYNQKSISEAYQQSVVIDNVLWDYSKDPTKVVLEFPDLTSDMRPVGPRRTEIFLTARQSEDFRDDSNLSFACCERSRAVTLAPRTVIVADSETITEFQLISSDVVSAISRMAVFLSPNPNTREGVLWQQINGRAVAFFDYTFDMRRRKEPFTLADGTVVERACVTTPKDIVQCY